MCMIPVRGEPCVSCRVRDKECTFLIGPTARKRKRPDAGPSSQPERSREPSSSVGLDWDAAPSPRVPLQPRTDDGVPLDDEAEDEETHFVGLGFFGLLPRDAGAATFSRHATLAFRQVSSDPRRPAYFIKHPSLLYGRGPSSASAALDEVRRLCAPVAPDIPARALHLFTTITLPALPFVHPRRLAQSNPPALVAGIVAHCTSYIPEIRHLHRALWQQALLALEDEYRQPRLRTLQLALLILTSRPSENVGQREIGLARAAGKLLERFFSVHAITAPQGELTRLAALEGILADLEAFEDGLPDPLRSTTGLAPTGVRSFQLSLCGLYVITHRTIIEALPSGGVHISLAHSRALDACERLSALVLSLTDADRAAFWMPYSSHHISNAASLLLRLALAHTDGALACTASLVHGLVDMYSTTRWDIAEAALRRIAVVLAVGSRELPLAETYRTVADTLGMSAAPEGEATDQLLESLGVGQADWLDADLSWLDSAMLFGALDSAGLSEVV
ncbi:unnamed protein product [Cutaneotrichosporon oleaginosum]